ncbi:MAG: O-antigen polysaccharide polymerase Wzy family protein [Youngiibacter sp.]|nr:O-antigen polysaccharide polymerase Wzy family protein [Youngiibacter sp.]
MYHDRIKLNQNINVSLQTTLQLIVLIIVLVIVFIQKLNIENIGIGDSKMMQLCWINNIAFIIQIIILKKVLGSYANPMLLFSIFLFLFSSGQFVLYSLNFEIQGFNIFDRVNINTLGKALLFIIAGYSMYQFGVIIAMKKGNIYVQKTMNSSVTKNNFILKAGVLFLLIGIIPYAIGQYNNFRIILTQGYMAYYREGVRSWYIFEGLSYYFFTGLIFISVGGNKRHRTACTITLTAIALLRLVSGDRGDGIVYIISAFLIYEFLGEKHNIKTWKLIIISFVCMAFIPIVATYRRYGINEDISISRFIYEVLLENNIVINTLETLGGTIFPLAKTMELVPLIQNHLYGMSYLASLILLIPRPLRMGFLADFAGNKLYTSPATWLMNSLNMTYGPGYTPFAEAYLNFGWIGIAFMWAFGFGIAKLMCANIKREHNVLLKRGVGILTFLFFAMASRGSFNYMLPYYLRYVFVPYIFIIILERPLKQKVV